MMNLHRRLSSFTLSVALVAAAMAVSWALPTSAQAAGIAKACPVRA